MPFFDRYAGGFAPGGRTLAPVGSVVAPFESGQALQNGNWLALHRPYLDDYGRPSVIVNTGRYTVEKGEKKPIRQKRLAVDLLNEGWRMPGFVLNATSLRKEDWIELDRRVVLAQRDRLRAWADLVAASSFGGFDAYGKMTLEYEAMSDPGEAVVDMDATGDGRDDYPLFSLRSVPLPITHSDFHMTDRLLNVSRSGSTPLDMAMGEAASRRVAEMVEDTLIGIVTGVTYGGQTTGITAHDTATTSTVYGYTNFSKRLTKTNMTIPTGSNPDTTVSDVLAMRSTLYNTAKNFGPFMVYHSTDWDRYLDDDYVKGTAAQGLASPGTTLRDRLKRIEGISDVRRLDRLTNTFTMIMVNFSSGVVEAINGMDVKTLQWDEKGGLELRFKVMSIQVPRFKYDYNGNSGIMHGTTA